MILTLLLAGLVIGRWWLVPIAAVSWPAMLILDGIGTGWAFGASAGAIAAANVGIAVALHRGAAFLLRRLVRFLRDPVGEAAGQGPTEAHRTG